MVQSLFGAVYRRRLFSPQECERLREGGGEASPWVPAKVSDGRGAGTTAGDKRASWSLVPLGPAHEWVFERVATFLAEQAQYGFALREIESPLKVQRYGVGDYHGWHVDLAGPGCHERKLGVSVQLSASDAYVGGDLEVYDPPGHQPMPRELGCAVAFPSYVPHQVSPVTQGVRFALTAWALGPPFR